VRSPDQALCNAILRSVVCIGSVFIGTFMLIIARILFFVDMFFSAEYTYISENMKCIEVIFFSFLNLMAWIIEKVVKQ